MNNSANSHATTNGRGAWKKASRLDRLEFFFGEAHPALARVYARLPLDSGDGGLTLSGEVTGPYCAHAQTLSASFALKQTSKQSPLLAETVLLDPSFWTPDLPHTYRVNVSLSRGSETLETAQFDWGIRPLGAKGKRFVFMAKSWTLRAARSPELEASEIPEWREHALAWIGPAPSDDFCAAATREGLLLVAELDDSQHLERELRRLGRHPAVAAVVLNSGVAWNEDYRNAARNVLFIARMKTVGAPPAWANALLIDAQEAEQWSLTQPQTVALLVERHANAIEPATARKECDILQRDLATYCDAAGFVV